MDIEGVYDLVRSESTEGDRARTLVQQIHWFSLVAEFDPKTAEPLPVALSTTAKRIRKADAEPPLFTGTELRRDVEVRDRLWRAIEHVRPALKVLFNGLGESPAKEQALLPLRAVRELNTSSFMALSRRPGRNVREKLATKPYLQAVRHYQSVDLPQNRLLKAFCRRLLELLEARELAFGQQDELVLTIDAWLRSGQAAAIGRWENLAPNNTLLSHRQYRAVWDAWRWLQSLDEDLNRDWNAVEPRSEAQARWSSNAMSFFADQPVFFKYYDLSITPWTDIAAYAASVEGAAQDAPAAVDADVAVDVSSLFPAFATTTSGPAYVEFPLLWQHWEGERDDGTTRSVDIDLGDAYACWTHQESTTVSALTLLVSSDVPRGLLDRAASAMTEALRRRFQSDTLVWLVPDIADDFSMEIMRRNLNSRFGHAEPLPKSVATVFAQVNHGTIVGPGYSVVVVDQFNGTRFATKLTAQHNADLEAAAPETHGYYWEREPALVIGAATADPFTLWSLDEEGEWHDWDESSDLPNLDIAALEREQRLAPFDLALGADAGSVTGGIRALELQAAAGEIPVWRDHLPELYMEVMSAGAKVEFPLVSRKVRISAAPRRGVKTRIPIDETFILPAGKRLLTFPLTQGSDEHQLEFVASLRSPALPLAQEERCRLELAYEYGADDPYVLRFVPLTASFPPIRVEWRSVHDLPAVDLGSLPVPPFPDIKSWADLQHWPRLEPGKDGRTERDLLEWVLGSLNLLREEQDLAANRQTGTFLFGRLDKNGDYYCRVDVDGERVFCPSRSFLEPISDGTLRHGDPVYLVVDWRGKQGPVGKAASYSAFLPESAAREAAGELEQSKLARLRGTRFPSFTIWLHGRSVSDPECPPHFRTAVIEGLGELESMWLDPSRSGAMRSELFYFLARTHRDAPVSVQRELHSIAVDRDNARRHALDYALGDCSQPWQKDLFDVVVANLGDFGIRVLAVALWRTPDPVRLLTAPDARRIGRHIANQIPRVLRSIERPSVDRPNAAKWAVQDAQRVAELLLALLRTRESPDQEMKAVLAPDTELGRTLMSRVDGLIRVLAQRSIDFTSRVSFEGLVKPADQSNVPDLLFALRLYLTGDDGATSIRIAGVTDE